MSKTTDRVEFTAKETDRFKEHSAKAASRAFGVHINIARIWFDREKRIRCRPSQFARFIIYRLDEGVEVNQIMVLRPKLIEGCHEAIHDVSNNPREV